MGEDTGYAGIVYWRRSPWNGARCVPVLLSLLPGVVRVQDRDGRVVLQEDPRKVGGRLTRLGTLLVDAGGRRYALVGRGAVVSPGPSAGQQAAVSGFRPPSAAGGGAVDLLLNGGAAARMRAWRTLLGEAGARLR
ncbi:hypothetical protein ACWER6_01975 [Streptomyces sp. NPDC004009]